MKNWIIVAAFASAILASCTKNEVRVDAPDQAISFTTAVGANSTKGMINDTAYPDSETFGTYAYYLPAGKSWPDNANDAKLYIPESEVKYKGRFTDLLFFQPLEHQYQRRVQYY